MAFPIPREAPVMSATLPFIEFVIVLPIPFNLYGVEIGAIPTTVYVNKLKVGIVPKPFNFNEVVPILFNYRKAVIGAVQVAVQIYKDLDGNWGNPGSH